MPIIPNTYTLESTYAESNLNEIQNLRVLIHTFDLAIHHLVANRHGSYEIDTGQNRQRVTRLNLPELVDTRSRLITELESRMSVAGLSRNAVVVGPCF